MSVLRHLYPANEWKEDNHSHSSKTSISEREEDNHSQSSKTITHLVDFQVKF